jgi:hypothetical protein
MIHTIEVQRHIYREKEFEELRSIAKGLQRKADIIEYKLNFPNMSSVGINNITLTRVACIKEFNLKLELNLSKLLGGGKLSLYRAGSNYVALCENFQSYMYQLLENNVNIEAFDDIEIFTDFNTYNITRIDYTVQQKVSDVKMYIDLLQRGDMPHKYGTEYKLHTDFDRKEEDGTLKPKSGSVFYKAKRYNVNFYDKADEVAKHGGTEEEIRKADGWLRLEVQCKSPALNYQRKAITDKKNRRLWDGEKPEDYRTSKTKRFNFFNDADISKKIVTDKFLEVAQRGVYYKRSIGLVKIKEAKGLHKTTKKKLIEIFEFVNPLGHKRRSIRDLRIAIEEGTYNGCIKSRKELDTMLKQFDKIGVNAVALKEDYKEDSLPNLYDVIIQEEYFVF